MEEVPDATFREEDHVTVICEPVLNPEDGMLLAVVRVDLPPLPQLQPQANVDVRGGGGESAKMAAAARDKVLEWVVSVLATAVEGAKHVGTLNTSSLSPFRHHTSGEEERRSPSPQHPWELLSNHPPQPLDILCGRYQRRGHVTFMQ